MSRGRLVIEYVRRGHSHRVHILRQSSIASLCGEIKSLQGTQTTVEPPVPSDRLCPECARIHHMNLPKVVLSWRGVRASYGDFLWGMAYAPQRIHEYSSTYDPNSRG